MRVYVGLACGQARCDELFADGAIASKRGTCVPMGGNGVAPHLPGIGCGNPWHTLPPQRQLLDPLNDYPLSNDFVSRPREGTTRPTLELPTKTAHREQAGSPAGGNGRSATHRLRARQILAWKMSAAV
jgi:hypothetical protein